MTRRTARVLALSALLIALTVGTFAARTLFQGGAASTPTPAGKILILLNARRHTAGLKPLHADAVLASLARAHNRSMLAGDYFAHDDPHGQTFAERVAYLHRRSTGENVAWGTGGFSTAAGFVSLWMADPAHRRIILTPAFRRVGVSVLGGRFQGQAGARVATADFST